MLFVYALCSQKLEEDADVNSQTQSTTTASEHQCDNHDSSEQILVPVMPSTSQPSSEIESAEIDQSRESISNNSDKLDVHDNDGSAESSSAALTRTKRSTFERHPWIITVREGYMCSTCKDYASMSSKSAGDKWITIPVAKSASDKLYKKAEKHARSQTHLFALACKSSQAGQSVNCQLIVAANRKAESNTDMLKKLFRLAYFLFKQEIPHTMNWRALISAASACDNSGDLMKYIKTCPANGHHLSPSAVVGMLEAYGTAIHNDITNKLQDITEYAVMADECSDVCHREMVSVCVRIIKQAAVEEVFIGCWPVSSTCAEEVEACVVAGLRSVGLKPENIVAASFDGAANMCGKIGGVQAKLKQHAPQLIYVHCRSHLLQLALVHSSNQIPEIKRTISLLNKLYSVFEHSPKKLFVLKTTQEAIDGLSHKLVQPGATRWLSYSGSVDVVVRHYTSICAALEAIYADAGDLSCDAGGFLLELRKASTMFVMLLLHEILQPLARLSKLLQTSSGNMPNAMSIVTATESSISSMDCQAILASVEDMKSAMSQAGTYVDNDLDVNKLTTVAGKYIKCICKNLKTRFSDDVSRLCDMQSVYAEKPDNPDFTHVAKLFHVDVSEMQAEWKILKRIPHDLSTQAAMIDLATSIEKITMFPTISQVTRRILLLPIGTASVERSFSTMNRILCDKRSRLLADHTRQLMLLSVEGPEVPDVRSGTDKEKETMDNLVNCAFKEWLKMPRRL